jgi:geranylgeranyl pyrophosphate synthase
MDLSTRLLEPELRYLSEKVKTIRGDSIWVQLPQACWRVAGGDDASGNICTFAFLAGTLALKTLDDVQDGHQSPACSNDGVALSFHALQLLGALPTLDFRQITRLQHSYTSTLLKLCAGQHLDLLGQTNVQRILDHSWDIASKKTAEWFAWGASLYPRYTGDEATENILVEFGTHIGLMHQIANDVRGFFDTSDIGDLKDRKASIPIAYLLTVIPGSSYEEEFNALWCKTETQSARQGIVDIARQNGVEQYTKLMSTFHAQQAHSVISKRFPALTTLINHPNLAL